MKDKSLLPERQLDLAVPCADQICQIQWSDLPLGCPLPDSSLWDAHPRVYLSIHEDGTARCPYCSTVYVLQPPEPDAPMPEFANIDIERFYRRALQRVREDSSPRKLDAAKHDPA